MLRIFAFARIVTPSRELFIVLSTASSKSLEEGTEQRPYPKLLSLQMFPPLETGDRFSLVAANDDLEPKSSVSLAILGPLAKLCDGPALPS